jgi:hypothetical protein
MLLPIFGSPQKINKNYRKKTKKIYSNERKTHGHLENRQRLVDKDKKYKD